MLSCRVRGAPPWRATVALQHWRARARSSAHACIGALTSVARIGHSPGQAEAFTAVPMHGMMLRSGPALSKGVRAHVAARPARAAVALRMQSEDDKAKASGVALALIGFVASGFSVFFAVLAGGLGIYAAKLPEEGDKGLSDTAKQVSLLLGTYSLKAFDFIKEKDAEGGYSAQLVEKIKGAVADAKSKIEK